MMVTFHQVNTIALECFLDRNPWLQAALDTLDEKDAHSQSLNIQEFRAQCSGQLIPDTTLSFSSARAGANPSLN